MKLLLVIVVLFAAYSCKGQVNNIKWVPSPLADTTKAMVCAVRGHVPGVSGMTTAMYCPPYVIDTDSTTIKVYPSCNTSTQYCQRCNSPVVIKEKEHREVIWKKLKDKQGDTN